MNNPDTSPKPATPKQPADDGLDETPCCASLTDTQRLDWLQAHHETVWKAEHEEYVQSTETYRRRYKQTVFDGWCVYPDCVPRPTIREAIDEAILRHNKQMRNHQP